MSSPSTVTVSGAKKAYVDGEISLTELERRIESALHRTERTQNMVEAGYAVLVAGVLLQLRHDAEEGERDV